MPSVWLNNVKLPILRIGRTETGARPYALFSKSPYRVTKALKRIECTFTNQMGSHCQVKRFSKALKTCRSLTTLSLELGK